MADSRLRPQRNDQPKSLPAGAAETVRVRLLGGFSVSVGSRTIEEDEWRLKKAASLVKLLALERGHRIHRERAMDLLWPEVSVKAAQNNLRRVLHSVRRTLEPTANTPSRYLHRRGDQLALCQEGVLWVDVEAFEEAAATARRVREPAACEAALNLYAGDLLPGDLYEDWAEERREHLRSAYLALLTQLAGLHEVREEHAQAIEALSRVAKEEPTHEGAHAGLMRLYALIGEHEEALRQYERLREVLLSRGLGGEPSDASRRLYEEIKAGSFPPSRRLPRVDSVPGEPLEAERHNLPAPRTSFVGRDKELVEVKRALAMTRLLTLTGMGGVGKTRLAMEVGRELVGLYPDGVWLAELASLSEDELVAQEVADTLSVNEQSNRHPVSALLDALRNKEMLLVLDNCEHLVEAAARLIDELLDGCPRLRVLATSREPLGIAGETNWPVSSLSSPDPRGAPSVEELQGYGAARLFVERARDRNPAFALTPQNAPAVAEICRQLEGLPLAVELAAARVGLTVEQIAERLDDSLGLLSTGNRTAVRRQRTLEGALDWSHELLGESERRMFGRLSAFAGGWTLEAAEALGAEGGTKEGDPLDLLSKLVEKSLVIAAPTEEGGVRYRMLEPVRQYAQERLRERGEEEKTKRRHAQWYLKLAEEAEEGSIGSEHATWTRRLEAEHDNLRAALRWSLDRGEAELGLRLAGALWPFWFDNGHSSEGRRWLERAIALGGSPEARAKALNGAGYITTFQNDYELAKAFLEESLDLYRRLGDEEGVASSLTHLGFFALLGQRDDVPATDLLEEALELRPRVKNLRTVANMLTLVFVGTIAELTGKDLVEVAALLEEGLVRFRDVKYAWGMKTCLANLGMLAVARAESIRAEKFFRELLLLSLELDEKIAGLHAFFGLGCVAALQGNQARAARLWAVSEVMQDSIGIQLPPTTRSFAAHEIHLAEARARLGEAGFEEAWAEGEAMSQDEAAGYALADEEEPTPLTVASERRETGDLSTNLTPREREIAELVAQGLTNRRVAEELYIAERTVDTHVGRILRKLALHSREQVVSSLKDLQ